MFVNDVERCEQCGATLPSYSGRMLDDELLCQRCHDKKAGSLRWLAVMLTADGALVLATVIAFIAVGCVPIPSFLVKAVLFGSAMVGIVSLRPHFQVIAKDLLMKKKRKL